MSEYIFDVPDANQPIAGDTSIYYPDERDDPMRVCEEIVRCRDCAYICNREYANGLEYHTCSYFDSEHAEVEPDGFCAWGVRGKP